MHRQLFRFVALAIAAPLLLGACRGSADPVKPKVAAPAAAAPRA